MTDKPILPFIKGWKVHQFVYGRELYKAAEDQEDKAECYCHESCGPGCYRYVVDEEKLDQQ